MNSYSLRSLLWAREIVQQAKHLPCMPQTQVWSPTPHTAQPCIFQIKAWTQLDVAKKKKKRKESQAFKIFKSQTKHQLYCYMAKIIFLSLLLMGRKVIQRLRCSPPTWQVQSLVQTLPPPLHQKDVVEIAIHINFGIYENSQNYISCHMW